MSESMKIGELAEKTGVTTRTIRYYEEINLIKPVSYSEKGFRLYSQNALDRINLIKALKDLDFTLEEIKKIISNMDSCESGKELADLLMPILNGSHSKAQNKIKTYLKLKDSMSGYFESIEEKTLLSV